MLILFSIIFCKRLKQIEKCIHKCGINDQYFENDDEESGYFIWNNLVSFPIKI